MEIYRFNCSDNFYKNLSEGTTQRALVGTLSACLGSRLASFVKTCNVLKVLFVKKLVDAKKYNELKTILCLLKIMKDMLFAGCADNSNCPGFDSLCNPLDHSNCSFCDNNNCTAGGYIIYIIGMGHLSSSWSLCSLSLWCNCIV